jgi:hypothetical protein
MRKRWRLKMYPTFRYQRVTSQKQAYAYVQAHREAYANGGSIHQVDVQVNEDDEWVLYESIIFPERVSA